MVLCSLAVYLPFPVHTISTYIHTYIHPSLQKHIHKSNKARLYEATESYMHEAKGKEK